MFKIEQDVEINRPPDAVFDFIADVRNEPDWNPVIKSATLVSSQPIGTGTRFDVVRKGSGLSRMTVTTFERPSDLVIQSTFRGGEYTYTAHLEPKDSGTHLHERVEMNLKGPMKLLASMIQKRLAREVPETAERMKRAVESLPQPAQQG
jgi:carbon monoxide dehydrogenase subunit G